MSDDSDNQQWDVQQTISMFEQILEVMPDDEMALRTLYDTYTMTGQRDKAFDMLNRLCRMAITERDEDTSYFLKDQFKDFEDLDTVETRALHEKVLSTLSDQQAADDAFSFGGSSDDDGINPLAAWSSTVAPAGEQKDAELAMAWKLFKADLLSQDDYSMVLQDLTEMSSKKLDVPASVLHVLHDRSYSHFSTIITYLVRETGTPFISLTNFDVSEELYSMVPMDYMKHRGAICFQQIGRELLIGILNPLDNALREQVRLATGKKCHFYLVVPEEYDALLNKIKTAFKERDDAGKNEIK